MTLLDPVAAQVASTGIHTDALLNPVFLFTLGGSLALLGVLIYCIIHDGDIDASSGEELGSRLSGRPTSGRPIPGRDTRLTVSAPDEDESIRRLVPGASPTRPRHPDHRGRPAA